MGEEEKKAEEKKTEQVKKEEPPKESDEKPKDDDKKAEESKAEPATEIVMRVFMHCEGCARKVRKSLKGFPGVEDVVTDCKTHKVVVKGEKADPLKVLERVEKKSHRQVQLLSPIPKPPPPDEPNKPEQVIKPLEKKQEPQVITVVLKVHMHCEACAQGIKRRIQKMKGVENAEPDLKNSQVTVKGAFEALQLLDYVSKRVGKRAVMVKLEPEKKQEDKPKEEKKSEDEAKKAEEDNKEKKEEVETAAAAKEEEAVKEEENNNNSVQDPKVEVKKNEFYYYHQPESHQMNNPQRFAHEMYAYPPPPQIFSDENPNACSVM